MPLQDLPHDEWIMSTSYLDLSLPQASINSTPTRSGILGHRVSVDGSVGYAGRMPFSSLRSRSKRGFLSQPVWERATSSPERAIDHRCLSSTGDGGILRFLQVSSARQLLPVCYTGNPVVTPPTRKPISTAKRASETESD